MSDAVDHDRAREVAERWAEDDCPVGVLARAYLERDDAYMDRHDRIVELEAQHAALIERLRDADGVGARTAPYHLAVLVRAILAEHDKEAQGGE